MDRHWTEVIGALDLDGHSTLGSPLFPNMGIVATMMPRLERSSIEAYASILIGVILFIFPASRAIQIVAPLVVGALLVDLSLRSPLTVKMRLPLKLALAFIALGAEVTAVWAYQRSSRPTAASSHPAPVSTSPATQSVSNGCIINGGSANNSCNSSTRVINKWQVRNNINVTGVRLSENEGVLLPGRGKMDQTSCGVPQKALAVEFGTNVAYTTLDKFTILSINDEPLIQVERYQNHLRITILRVFDDRDNIIARIDENGFWVDRDNRVKRPNANTLIVFDHLDQEVLNIEYVNSYLIKVQGIFRVPGGDITTITSSEMNLPRDSVMDHSCLGNSKTAIAID